MRDVSRLIVYAIAGVYAAVCVATLPEGPFTAPDSVAYLEMQPIVPLGYAAVLRGVGPSLTVTLQPLIFAASLAWLGIEILQVTKLLTVAAVVMLAVAATPDLRQYHFSILTESLFASGLVAFLAAATSFVRQPSWKRIMAAAAIVGITATLRRTAYAFLPALVLMVLMHRRRAPERVPAMLLAAVLPIIAVAGVESIAARAIHGDSATSLMGRHLFAKAALVESPVTATLPRDPYSARLQQALQVEYAPIRALIARAPRELRASLTVYYETCLQGPCVEHVRASLGGMSDAQKNAALGGVATGRISTAPLDWLRLTATHYGALWTPFKLRHPATAETMNAFVAANRPLPFEREAFKVTSREVIEFRGSHFVRLVQPAILAVGWVTGAIAMVGVASAIRGRVSELGAASTTAAFTAHACLVLSAAAAAGISRFMVPALPAVMTALGFAAAWGWRQGAVRRTREAARRTEPVTYH